MKVKCDASDCRVKFEPRNVGRSNSKRYCSKRCKHRQDARNRIERIKASPLRFAEYMHSLSEYRRKTKRARAEKRRTTQARDRAARLRRISNAGGRGADYSHVVKEVYREMVSSHAERPPKIAILDTSQGLETLHWFRKGYRDVHVFGLSKGVNVWISRALQKAGFTDAPYFRTGGPMHEAMADGELFDLVNFDGCRPIGDGRWANELRTVASHVAPSGKLFLTVLKGRETKAVQACWPSFPDRAAIVQAILGPSFKPILQHEYRQSKVVMLVVGFQKEGE